MSDCVSCRTPIPDNARYCSTCGSDQTGAEPRDPMAELQDRLARTLSGRYEVRGLLGAGGMAAVFLADDLALEREVAIKVLPPELARDQKVVARFQREAKTAAKLDHPHIIPIHRVESEAGLEYFVMKYVRGRSLDDVIGGGALPLDFVVRVLTESAHALGHAHKHGVVHRDVKPANIMLDPEDRVVLTDFGISKAGDMTSQLTHTGVIVGTPYYMAPEQALGQSVDGRADQYALGVVGWQLLTGRTPFDGESAHTIIYKHIHEPAPALTSWRDDVPPHVIDAITRAMAKKPDQRWPSMYAFAAALAGHPHPERAGTPVMGTTGSGIAVGARTIPLPSASTDPTVAMTSAERAAARPRRRLALIAGAVLLAAAGAATVAFWPRTPEPPLVASIVGDSVPTTATEHPTTDSSAAVTDTTASVAPDSARTTTAPRPTPRTRRTTPPREPTVRVALLTIASEPYGTVYIDGVEIGETPIANYSLPIGRTYRLRVEREGYRPKRETIRVDGPNPIRRRYILEQGDSR